MTAEQPSDARAESEENPLNIAPSTISYIIERAREAFAGVPVEVDDDDPSTHWSNEDDFREIAEFIDDLNDDERIDLVVLMWIGRGTYGADELEQARQDARREATHKTSEYLLSTPLVPDFLADGLEAFGEVVEES
ncbi:MAG: DUF3775 domain-containing protein [Rhodothalassiaceae bacterium]